MMINIMRFAHLKVDKNNEQTKPDPVEIDTCFSYCELDDKSHHKLTVSKQLASLSYFPTPIGGGCIHSDYLNRGFARGTRNPPNLE